MSRVINRQNVVIVRNLNGAVWKESNIGTQVKFQPDELVIKQITFKYDGTAPGAYLLKSDQLGVLGSFYDGCSINTDIRILAKNFSLSSSIDFGVYAPNPNNELLLSALTGVIAIHLEFVQYDKPASK